MSDINLKNLSKGESGAPPPNTKKLVNRDGRGRPNRGRHKTRISARRIGGQNYAQDVAALKRAREQAARKNNTNPQSTGVMKPVNMSLRNTPKKSIQNNGTLPRVQELGGIKGSRRSSSRMRLGSGRVSHQRSRKSSSTSNHSGVQNDSVPGSSGRGETIIRYGELLKKGVVTTQWKKRFFVLTEAHLFYYLETFDVPQELHQIELEPKGKIELGLVEEVRKDKNNSSVFQIFTPTRTYRLKLEGEGDVARYGVSAWVASIRGACENAKQQHLNGVASKMPRGSFSSYKVDEMDQAVINANQYKHPAKRLIDAETMYSNNRKGPHQPAALDEYEDWTPFDVSAWLYTVHLQKYSEDFYQQQIDGKALKKVNTGEEAAKLGVEEDDITKFMAAVQTLKDMNLISDLPLN